MYMYVSACCLLYAVRLSCVYYTTTTTIYYNNNYYIYILFGFRRLYRVSSPSLLSETSISLLVLVGSRT